MFQLPLPIVSLIVEASKFVSLNTSKSYSNLKIVKDDDSFLTIVATDSYRFYLRKINVEQYDLPRFHTYFNIDALKYIKDVFKHKLDIFVEFMDENIIFKVNDTLSTFPNVVIMNNLTYPDYEKIFVHDFYTHTSYGLQDFMSTNFVKCPINLLMMPDVIKFLKFYKGKLPQIPTVTFKFDGIIFSGYEKSEIKKVFIASHYDISIPITLNLNYFVDIVKMYKTNSINMFCATNIKDSPILLSKNLPDNRSIDIIMPIRSNY